MKHLFSIVLIVFLFVFGALCSLVSGILFMLWNWKTSAFEDGATYFDDQTNWGDALDVLVDKLKENTNGK